MIRYQNIQNNNSIILENFILFLNIILFINMLFRKNVTLIDINCDNLYLIFLYLSNYELYNLSYLCKYIKNIYSKKYFLKLIYQREHPMVFNILDNYCRLCNMNKFFRFTNKGFDNCLHF